VSHVEIISASAGTGKTTRLARLIHEAVASNIARPEAVLATTFTRRAAAELVERARQTLLEAGEANAAHRLHAARVGTVNSVSGGIVQEFAFLHGLSPRISVLDERRASEEPLRAGAETLPSELMNELEDLHTRMGPVGPHPGGIMAPGEWDWKQDVLRVVDLARSNAIEPGRFAEFVDRSTIGVLRFLGAPTTDAQAVDRALEMSLKSFLQSVDLDVDTTKKTRDAYERVRAALARGARRLPWSEWANLAQLEPAKKSEIYADAVRKAAAAHDRHPRLYDDLRRAVRAIFEAAAYVIKAYQAYKTSLGVIDFVDQETEALKLLRDETVRAYLREEIDLVLVDEFQDTSPIQLAIFLELSKVAPRSIWVGDPKQAIYGFRGTDPALMDAAVASLLKGRSPETLDRSYRSRPSLVRLTSDLFAPAFAESGIREELVRVEPGLQDDPPGMGPVFERWVLEKTGNARHNAELDLISLASGVSALLADPAARVRDRVTGEVRGIQPGDVAVLCFRNDQCIGLARELEARGVRAVVGRPGLMTTLEARLAIAALRLWIDPSDALARAELARWLDHDDDAETWLKTVLETKGRDELFANVPQVRALRDARQPRAFAGVLAAFDAALAAVGVRERAVTFGDATARLANLDALRALAASYVELCHSEGTPCSMRGLLVHLDDLASELLDSQATADRPDAVCICTLHSSKGLEWPVAVLADLTDRPDVSALGLRIVSDRESIDLDDPLGGRWLRYWPGPYGRKRKDVPFLARLEDHEASRAAKEHARREALRLVYVGWTRARDRLVYAARPGRIADGGLTVLSAGGVSLLSEPTDDGRAMWGAAEARLEFDVVVRKLPPIREDGRGRAPAQGYAPAGLRSHPPASVNPSQLEGKASIIETIEIGTRIPSILRDEEEVRRFGDAVHAFLAADRPTLPTAEREALAREILRRFVISGAIEDVRLPQISDQLIRWIDSSWPGSELARELPLLHRLPSGTLLRGTADLVVDTKGGLVLVDHKAFPGSREQAVTRAGEYAGQLSAYAHALTAARKTPLLGAFIHLPISGLACRVEVSSGVEVRNGDLWGSRS
jgi:ATP-dependent exoDNAse (exonuclease V) beta subunit